MPDDEIQTGRKNSKEQDASRPDSPSRAEPGLEDETPSESIAEQRIPGHARTNGGARPRAADLVRLFANITDNPALLQGAIEDLREIVGERVVREFQVLEERVSHGISELERRFDSLETAVTGRMDRHMSDVNGQSADLRSEFSSQSADLRSEFNSQFAAFRSEFNDRLESLKSDLIGRMEVLKSDLIGRMEVLKSDFDDRFKSLKSDFDDQFSAMRTYFDNRFELQNANFDARFRVLEAELKSLRREFRIIVALFSILTAIGLYSVFSERREPQIIIVPSAQLAQPDASGELEGVGENVRSQSKEAERNNPNVAPDAEDPPSPTGPE